MKKDKKKRIDAQCKKENEQALVGLLHEYAEQLNLPVPQPSVDTFSELLRSDLEFFKYLEPEAEKRGLSLQVFLAQEFSEFMTEIPPTPGMADALRGYGSALIAANSGINGGALLARTLQRSSFDGVQQALVPFLQEKVNGYEAMSQAEGQRKQQGGIISGQIRNEANTDRNKRIHEAAARLLQTGTAKRDVAGKLATQFGLSSKTIREVLRNPNVS